MEEWCLDCWQNASNYFLMGYHYQAVLGGNYLAYFRSEGALLFNASYSFSQHKERNYHTQHSKPSSVSTDYFPGVTRPIQCHTVEP